MVGTPTPLSRLNSPMRMAPPGFDAVVAGRGRPRGTECAGMVARSVPVMDSLTIHIRIALLSMAPTCGGDADGRGDRRPDDHTHGWRLRGVPHRDARQQAVEGPQVGACRARDGSDAAASVKGTRSWPDVLHDVGRAKGTDDRAVLAQR